MMPNHIHAIIVLKKTIDGMGDGSHVETYGRVSLRAIYIFSHLCLLDFNRKFYYIIRIIVKGAVIQGK